MNNLLLFMSLSGSIAFVIYLVFKFILRGKLSPTYRYWLLKIVLCFYLLPIPLLANDLRDLFRNIFHDENLFVEQYEEGVWYKAAAGKTLFITDDGLSFVDFSKPVILCMIIWFILLCTLIIYYVYHCHKERILIRSCSEECPEAYTLLNDEYNKVAHKHHVTFRVVPRSYPSFTYGIKHPTVIFSKMDNTDDMKFIIMHELTHIRCFDALFLNLCFMAMAVHFFNPLIYLFFFEMRNCIELHCDEVVVKAMAEKDKITYGHLLIQRAQNTCFTKYAMPFVDTNYKIIKERITVIKTNTPKRILTLLISAITMMVLGGIPVFAYTIPTTHDVSDIPEFIENWDDMYMSPGLEGIPEEEQYFSGADAYFIDENGNIIYETPNHIVPYSCRHTYKDHTYMKHQKLNSGGCIVNKYTCKLCTRCKDTKNSSRISSTKYDKCIHK